MRLLMAILGYINGKIGVKCSKCLRLKQGKCFGRETSELEQNESRTCGFWKKRYVWIKRHSADQNSDTKLKHHSD